jgi:hypothetical protein
MQQQEPMTREQEIQLATIGHMLCAETGVTTAQEGATRLAELQTIKRASDAGANIINVVAFPFITDVDEVLAEHSIATWGT